MTKNVVKFNSNFWIMSILLVLNLFWVGFFVSKNDGLTHIYFLDVGQGDSILVTMPNNQNILIDGGPSSSLITEIDRVLPFWKRNIDLMVLTHPHADHVTGLIEVATRYQVDEFLYNGVQYDTHTYQELLNVVDERNIFTQVAGRGMEYNFESCQLDILYVGDLHTTSGDLNDTSIVSEITCGEFNAIFPADADVDIEQQLISSGSLSDVEVLKVGHHGSKYSTSAIFLETIEPEVAVITVGKNKFGHPHSETLKKLADIQAEIFSTLESGTVEAVTDGQKYNVITSN
jgi:competence protein ComEC